MIVKGKILKFSSLCIMGALTIWVNDFMPNSMQKKANKIFSSVGGGSYIAQVGNSDYKGNDKSSNDTKMSKSNKNEEKDQTEKTDTEKKVENTDKKASTDDKTKEKVKEDEKKTIDDVIPAMKGIKSGKINLDDYKDLVIAKVEGYLNVRKGAGTDYAVIAKLPPNAAGFLKETKMVGDVKWCKIKSGDVEGYVSSEYLITGDEALAKIVKVGRYVIKVDCDVLNVREKASTNSDVLYKISKGEELEVVNVKDGWVEVNVDVAQETAFVSEEYVKISFELKKAVKVDEKLAGSSTVRTQIVQYAKKFLGNRYVYGGESLTNGIDCSAYVRAIYRKFGYNQLNRTAAEQSKQGTAIKESQLKPGDLVFYTRNGRVSHVAMFIGDGKIIHASNPSDGIKISNMKYTTPYRYVNIIGDL